ncbi:hypothetical protein TcasGA2_TC013978 [Tribolium castaneum]|uniref:DUF3421 domain-containing protein n=1 Tax=Tribolium castaneum TaxID=7070 RepID=D6WIY1_TRICA|nr:PREDICTED: uncharacterized protein LOC103312905 [Tribolium castaneum]EFA03860.1 hypothetical protein TcasGA2_TC013978 [Tribolium castaneum]|eukprot:XP_008192979.1 PREDICTED: uncharacterized protein LOC103312905 [Tribolium castaneum]
MRQAVLYFWMISACFGAGSDYYYWREFTGVVPPDALPGGKDADGRRTYIGEAYVHNHGIYVVQIYPGVKEVEVPAYGPKSASFNIKILCTEDPESFFWIKTSAKTYEKDIEGLEPVTAGYDGVGNSGVVNVGRIFYQGEVLVGDVTPYASRKGNVQLWFPFRKMERAVNFYELLVVYVPNGIEPRMGII